MKPIKIILYLFFFVLIISNVFWLFQAVKNTNVINSYKQREDFIQGQKKTQLNMRFIQIKSEGTQIGLSEEFEDENGKVNRLIDLVKDSHFRIVLRYSQIGCHTCIDKKVQLMKQEFSDIDRNKVLILSKLSTKRDLVAFRRIHSLENPIYQYDKNLTSIDSINVPYFFILTKSGIIEKVFIPQDDIDEELTTAYLKYIAKLLKD